MGLSFQVLNNQLNDIVNAVEQLSADARTETVPLVRARITRINGRDLADITDLQDAQRRDSSQDRYKLSYLAENIDGVTVVEGAWWSEPVTGLPKVGLEDREARKLSLQVGEVAPEDPADKTVSTAHTLQRSVDG